MDNTCGMVIPNELNPLNKYEFNSKRAEENMKLTCRFKSLALSAYMRDSDVNRLDISLTSAKLQRNETQLYPELVMRCFSISISHLLNKNILFP